VVGWVRHQVIGVLIDTSAEGVDALAVQIASPRSRWRSPVWAVAAHADTGDAATLLEQALGRLDEARQHGQGAVVWTDGSTAEP